MKTYRLLASILLCIAAFSFVACDFGEEEIDFSKDYDIKWTVSEITDVSPLSGTVGTQVTLTGKNLGSDLVQPGAIKIGTAECEIVSQSATSVVVKVPVLLDATPVEISVKNLLHRTFVYPQKFTPIM
jgi:hypothetical protein